MGIIEIRDIFGLIFCFPSQALYENMLVELPFASFFLRKLTTPGRGWVGPHYLSSLDSEYYRQVLSLKNYDGDFDELDIYFTTLSNEYGQIKVSSTCTYMYVELYGLVRNLSCTVMRCPCY